MVCNETAAAMDAITPARLGELGQLAQTSAFARALRPRTIPRADPDSRKATSIATALVTESRQRQLIGSLKTMAKRLDLLA